MFKLLSLVCCLATLFFCSTALADDVSLVVTKGINHTNSQDSYLGALAYAQDLPKGLNPGKMFFIEEQATVYTDPVTFVGSVGPGLEYNPTDRTYVRATLGVSGMTRTNDELGGYFQFILKGGVGIKFNLMGNQFRIGPVYTHYSSAGIYARNSGYDFVGVELGVELPDEYKIADGK